MVSIRVVPLEHGLTASFSSLPTSRELPLATVIGSHGEHG